MPKLFLWCFRFLASLPKSFVFFLFSIVPRSKTVWIFSAWEGKKFLDNPKYLFLYCLKNNPKDISLFWIAKDKSLVQTMSKMGLPVLYAYSLKGVWTQLRAAVVIFTHSVEWEFLPYLIGRSAKKIQVWHGLPIKKIGYDDELSGNLRIKMRILSFLIPYLSDRCDLVIASSETDKRIFESAFNVKPENICITGLPRTDLLAKKPGISEPNQKKKIIYLPTLRGEVGSEFLLFQETAFPFQDFNLLMEELGAEFYIKLHPVQKFSKEDLETVKRYPNLIPFFNEEDIYEQLADFDVLINDFSGVYFDFLITGKPIIMAPLLMVDYVNNDRKLYYSYQDVCPDEPCYTWPVIVNRLREVLGKPAPSARYLAHQKKFHRFLDGKSCERVVSEIENILDASASPIFSSRNRWI